MSPAEPAERIGCTRQTIIALEQGKYVPPLSLAFKIARVIRAPLEAVFECAGRSDED